MKLKQMILIVGDLVLALFAFYSGLLAQHGYVEANAEAFAKPFSRLLPYLVTLLFVSYILEAYNIGKHRNKRGILANILIAGSISFFILSTLFYLDPNLTIDRIVLISSLTTFVMLQFLWHVIYIIGFDHPYLTERILVLGTGILADKVGTLINMTKSHHNHMLVGYVGCESERGTVSVPEDMVVGNAYDLIDIALREKASKIIVSLSERRGVFPLREVLNCKLKGVEIVDTPAFFEQATGKLMVESMTPSWLIFSTGFKRTALITAAKRAIDIILSVTGMILSLPLFPIIAMLVKFDSPGPILFKQVRVGNKEKEFVLYKFRTMGQDAESKTGAIWAQTNDPRLRPIGKFLRKFRFDELPQLYNVLRGDMSFVGPRPERPEFVDKLKEIIPFYSKRHFIKPGLTGWAQVRYPYGASVDDAVEKLRFDLYYIKNMSPILDTIIVLQTFKVVIFGRGGR